jgi:hypothetical protein
VLSQSHRDKERSTPGRKKSTGSLREHDDFRELLVLCSMVKWFWRSGRSRSWVRLGKVKGFEL